MGSVEQVKVRASSVEDAVRGPMLCWCHRTAATRELTGSLSAHAKAARFDAGSLLIRPDQTLV